LAGMAEVSSKFEENKAAIPRRLWRIRHADNSLWSHSFTPPATLPEVRRLHPHALAIEPEGGEEVSP
jgi:hypothetical protein